MARTEHYFTPFQANHFYHVYNRSVDRKPLFTQDRNFLHFLTRMEKYLIPFMDIFAYNLPRNHFHLIVKIKPEDQIYQSFALDRWRLQQKKANLPTDIEPNKEILADWEAIGRLKYPVSSLISHSFQRMFQSYAMSFNKQEDRVGTLFQTPVKRALIDTENYLKYGIFYVHANAQSHKLVADFRQDPWGSYQRYMLHRPNSLLPWHQMMDIFGGLEGFVTYHKEQQRRKDLLKDEMEP